MDISTSELVILSVAYYVVCMFYQTSSVAFS